MNSLVKIYSDDFKELATFLELFFSKETPLDYDKTHWQKYYENPVEIADIVAAFVDNKNSYPSTNMWVSIDTGVFINITNSNYNNFIKYLFERYPY